MKILNKINIILSDAENQTSQWVSITKKQMYELLSTEYSEAFNAYKNKHALYRGTIKKGKFGIQNPVYRGSAYAKNNIYTTLFSEMLPSWKDYPKRNMSIIMTNSYNRAEDYNDKIYNIFPHNGAKIGVCPGYDLWYSFKKTAKQFNYDADPFYLGAFTYQLDNFFKNTVIADKPLFSKYKNYIGNDSFYRDSAKLLEFFNDLDIYYSHINSKITLNNDTNEICFTIKNDNKENNIALPYSACTDYIVKSYGNGEKSLLIILDKLLNTKENDFKLITASGIAQEISNTSSNEVWTDSPCLLIDADELKYRLSIDEKFIKFSQKI